VQWRLLMPFAILLALTVVGLTIGLVSDRFAFFDAGDGKAVILFWSIYNLFVLALTIFTCVELPRQERHIADAPERAQLIDGKARPVWIARLTTTHARIRGVDLPEGHHISLVINGIGEVPGTSLGSIRDGCRIQLHTTPEQFDALQLRLYTEDNIPGVPGARLGALAIGLARRLAFRH